MADVDGRRCQVERNLQEENQRADALVRALPSLTVLPEMDGQWFADQVDEALQLLLDLQAAQARDEVKVEWPVITSYSIHYTKLYDITISSTRA